MRTRLLLPFVMGLVCFPTYAFADSAGGHGSDMWTRTFEQWGLFTPHEDYCDSSTEVFVAVSGTAQRGFCIEKNERQTAVYEDARDDCAADKKRLPEPVEWKFACKNAAGLSNMTDNQFEWAGNYPILFDGAGMSAARIGKNSCIEGSRAWIVYSGTGGQEDSYPYRCIR